MPAAAPPQQGWTGVRDRPAACPGPATSPTSRQKYGVTNVYGDVGQLFAQSVVAEPRLGAALMGILVKGLGDDHVCWGTDAIWTGSPQWQIEALRRLEIPEDMQKKYGFTAAGRADGAVKTAIFSGNNMRLYGLAEAHRPRRPLRRHERGVPRERRRPQQPALRLRAQTWPRRGLSSFAAQNHPWVRRQPRRRSTA